MRKTLLLTLGFLFALFGKAQQESNNSVLDVEMNHLEYYNPEQIANYIIILKDQSRRPHDVLSNNRFNDITTLNLRYENMVMSLNETVKSAFNDVNRFQCTRQLPNEQQGHRLTGVVTNISITSKQKIIEKKDKDGRTYKEMEITYNGNISLALTLTDLSNLHFNTHKFERESFNHDPEVQPEKILQDLIRGLQYDITRYYNERYPLHAHILELAEVKKDKVKELYLDVGQHFDVRKGQHFDLFTLGEVAGHTTQTKIGRVKVDEVRGTDVSLCEVQKGAKEIKDAVKNNKKIIAVSSY